MGVNKKKQIAEEVIIDFCKGDEKAVEEVYHYYFKQVYFFVYHNISDKASVPDVVQNTFISALKAAHQLKSTNAFSTWLMRIAFCESRNIYRRARLKKVDVNEENDLDILEDRQGNQTQEQIEKNQLYEAVYEGISEMKPKLKDVAILKYVDGFNDDEISKILKVPVGTIKSRNHTIRSSLQTFLKTRNITPKTYRQLYSFGIPASIVSSLEYGKGFVCLDKMDNAHKIIEASKVVVPSGISMLTVAKGALIVTTSLSVASLCIYFSRDISPKPMPEKKIPLEKNASIKNIEFNHNFTNQDIDINVSLSNKNYDEIRLNGQPNMRVSENGNYVVSILKDGKEVAHQDLKISNIDKHAPQINAKEIKNNEYAIYLNDDISGIDKTRILYKKNGVVSTEYQYDENKRVIYFTYDAYSENIFEINDNAGNASRITLRSKSYI